MKNNQVRRTFILIKPDAIERKLTGEILRRFERKGFDIIATSLRWINNEFAQEHYSEHKGNAPYFKQMCDAISKGPSLAVILEGPFAVEGSRQLIGNQQPIGGSSVGTIRGDFGIEAPFNLVHGSDSDSSAKREITLWFGVEFYNAPVEQETKYMTMSTKNVPEAKIHFGPPKKGKAASTEIVDEEFVPFYPTKHIYEDVNNFPLINISESSPPVSGDLTISPLYTFTVGTDTAGNPEEWLAPVEETEEVF